MVRANPQKDLNVITVEHLNLVSYIFCKCFPKYFRDNFSGFICCIFFFLKNDHLSRDEHLPNTVSFGIIAAQLLLPLSSISSLLRTLSSDTDVSAIDIKKTVIFVFSRAERPNAVTPELFS